MAWTGLGTVHSILAKLTGEITAEENQKNTEQKGAFE